MSVLTTGNRSGTDATGQAGSNSASGSGSGSEQRSVPALDLKAQYRTIQNEIDPVVRDVVSSQMFILGKEVAALEEEVAHYCHAKHGVGCASGSDALLLPLMGWDIGPGDEVVTTPYSFFATAGAIWRTGAKPVFADIDPDTYNIDPARISEAISARTKAIIPVHLYGQMADMNPILAIARGEREGARSGMIPVLEDAAQAIGAEYHGQRAGTMGTATAFSFYPSKNLGGFGDGGMITTNDGDLCARVARLRVHGMEPRYYHHEVGFNSRLDSLQAAILRVKLRHLEDWTHARREAALRYREMFDEERLIGPIVLPVEKPHLRHVFNQFVIRISPHLRDDLRAELQRNKVGTDIYYPIPLHLQKCFESLGYQPGDFPESEAAAKQTLALPMYPELPAEDQRYVVQVIADFVHHGRTRAWSAATPWTTTAPATTTATPAFEPAHQAPLGQGPHFPSRSANANATASATSETPAPARVRETEKNG